MREFCGKEIGNLTTNPMQAFGRDWMALAAGGRETCDRPGDCSHCEILCRSNEKYWGKVPPSRYSHYRRGDTQEARDSGKAHAGSSD